MTALPKEPMLAATAPDFADIQYPIGVLPKVDGVRMLPKNGIAFSRRLKPFPNRAVQLMTNKYSNQYLLDGLDGEAYTHTNGIYLDNADRDIKGETLCNRTSSVLMTIDGSPDIRHALFDAQIDGTFEDRHEWLVNRHLRGDLPEWCDVLPMEVAHNSDDLVRLEKKWVLEDGYEGLVLRNLKMAYKHGRSTVREHGLMRVTAWASDEAEILDAVEELSNDNAEVMADNGKMERPTHRAGIRPTDTLGAMVVRVLTGKWAGVECSIGTGWTDVMAKEYWEMHKAGTLAGRVVTFRHKEHGAKSAPRFPAFKGFRAAIDM